MSTSQPATYAPVKSERRGSPRVKVIDRELIAVDIDGGAIGGLVLNLSEGGMAVQALGRIKPGTKRTLRWQMPLQAETNSGQFTAIETTGTVAWTDRERCIGIRFDDLAAENQKRIARWLQERNGSLPTLPAEVAPQGEIATDLTARLAALVEDARAKVSADGAAIALEQGQEIVCRASSGAAPDVGVRLQPGSGLSGECLLLGKLVSCANTQTDPRVDASACRALNLGSAVVLPIASGARTAGLLECFWSNPNAFNEESIRSLRTIAERISAMLQPRVAAPPVRPAAAASGPAPVRVPVAPPAAPPPPAAPSPEETRTQEIRTAEVRAVELPSFLPAPSEPSRLAARWARLTEGLREDERSRVAIIAAAVFLLILASAFIYRSVRKSSPPEASISSPVETGPASLPVSAPAATQPPDSAVPTMTPTPAASVAAKKSPREARPSDSDRTTVVAKGNPPEAITVKPAAAPDHVPDPVAPPTPMTAAGGSSKAEIANLLGGLAPAKPRLAAANPVHSTLPVLLTKTRPEYPSQARALRRQGTVVLDVVVAATGKVAYVGVVSGDALLADAAVRTVKEWRFRPAERDGVAVPENTRVELHFRLPDR